MSPPLSFPRFVFYLQGEKVGEMKGGNPDMLRKEIAKYSAVAEDAAIQGYYLTHSVLKYPY
jgi:hypothetical protein